jgi:hypothetical protein
MYRLSPRFTTCASLVLTVAAALLCTGGAPATATLPDLNAKVLAFARGKMGSEVGDGSCTSLAIAALKEAGARPYPTAEEEGQFQWGEPVASFEQALPGDVLQFHNAVFQGKKSLSWGRTTTWHYSFPHHTAILARVSDGGKVVVVLHQNVTVRIKGKKDVKGVQETPLPMDSLQKGGWVHIFRPVAVRKTIRSTESSDENEP